MDGYLIDIRWMDIRQIIDRQKTDREIENRYLDRQKTDSQIENRQIDRNYMDGYIKMYITERII